MTFVEADALDCPLKAYQISANKKSRELITLGCFLLRFVFSKGQVYF